MRIRLWLAAISCGASMLGCNAVLGAHQLDDSAAGEGGQDAAAGSGGKAPDMHAEAGASGSRAGTTADDGGSAAAGRGGSPASNHGADAGAKAPEAGKKADPPAAGTPAMTMPTAGTTATAGTMAMPTMTGDVHGTVVDTLARPVTKLQVRIGDSETMTDDRGEFTIANVPASYDVALVFTREDTQPEMYRNAWVFEGLQRRNPVLEIYPGASNQGLRLTVKATGLSSTLPQGQLIYTAFGGKEGDGQGATVQNEVEIGGYWQGAEVMPGNVHALLFNGDDNELPLEYLAADAKAVTLQIPPNENTVSVDLTGPKPAAAAISGTVKHVRTDLFSETWVDMRWADGVTLALQGVPNAAFSLLAPKLADAAVTIVALEGAVTEPPYAITFVDNVAPGTSGLALTIPATAELRAPSAMKTNVDASTSFEWVGGDSKVCVFRVQSKLHSDEVFVVTTKKSAHLPSIYMLPANSNFTWQVETHGTGDKSVDDIAEKGDWLSAFWYDRLRGPKRGDGSYTTTELRAFTTAP